MWKIVETITNAFVRATIWVCGRLTATWWKLTDRQLTQEIRDAKDDEEAKRIIERALAEKNKWFRN